MCSSSVRYQVQKSTVLYYGCTVLATVVEYYCAMSTGGSTVQYSYCALRAQQYTTSTIQQVLNISCRCMTGTVQYSTVLLTLNTVLDYALYCTLHSRMDNTQLNNGTRTSSRRRRTGGAAIKNASLVSVG